MKLIFWAEAWPITARAPACATNFNMFGSLMFAAPMVQLMMPFHKEGIVNGDASNY
jgi:hypothetical protein